jgi:hypothetical protein
MSTPTRRMVGWSLDEVRAAEVEGRWWEGRWEKKR